VWVPGAPGPGAWLALYAMYAGVRLAARSKEPLPLLYIHMQKKKKSCVCLQTLYPPSSSNLYRLPANSDSEMGCEKVDMGGGTLFLSLACAPAFRLHINCSYALPMPMRGGGGAVAHA
jgi:hypothetical protein